MFLCNFNFKFNNYLICYFLKKFAKNEGEVLIKTINMSGSESASEDEAENDDVTGIGKPVNPIKDSFFLGGVSESDDEEEDNDESKTKENKLFVDPTLNRWGNNGLNLERP